jgi:hypothetical protein
MNSDKNKKIDEKVRSLDVNKKINSSSANNDNF